MTGAIAMWYIIQVLSLVDPHTRYRPSSALHSYPHEMLQAPDGQPAFKQHMGLGHNSHLLMQALCASATTKTKGRPSSNYSRPAMRRVTRFPRRDIRCSAVQAQAATLVRGSQPDGDSAASMRTSSYTADDTADGPIKCKVWVDANGTVSYVAPGYRDMTH